MNNPRIKINLDNHSRDREGYARDSASMKGSTRRIRRPSVNEFQPGYLLRFRLSAAFFFGVGIRLYPSVNVSIMARRRLVSSSLT